MIKLVETPSSYTLIDVARLEFEVGQPCSNAIRPATFTLYIDIDHINHINIILPDAVLVVFDNSISIHTVSVRRIRTVTNFNQTFV
jgi:hypothetical protein